MDAIRLVNRLGSEAPSKEVSAVQVCQPRRSLLRVAGSATVTYAVSP